MQKAICCSLFYPRFSLILKIFQESASLRTVKHFKLIGKNALLVNRKDEALTDCHWGTWCFSGNDVSGRKTACSSRFGGP